MCFYDACCEIISVRLKNKSKRVYYRVMGLILVLNIGNESTMKKAHWYLFSVSLSYEILFLRLKCQGKRTMFLCALKSHFDRSRIR